MATVILIIAVVASAFFIILAAQASWILITTDAFVTGTLFHVDLWAWDFVFGTLSIAIASALVAMAQYILLGALNTLESGKESVAIGADVAPQPQR